MNSHRSSVLLLTHSGDYFTVDRVAEALTRRGARPVRLDTDRFPRELRLVAEFDGAGWRHVAADRDWSVHAGEVRAVWARRVWRPQLADDLAPEFREACERESRAALRGFLDGLAGARWVNDPDRTHQAENKLRQIRTAQAVGLRVPRTLVTNDPEAVRRFHGELGGEVVAKLLTPLSVSMGPPSHFVYTSEVRAEDLAGAEALRHCPMVFQERIPKAFELRVAVVAGRYFAGAIDASRSAAGHVDWRRASPEECRFQHASVPPDDAGRLVALMSKLGLVFGAVDLIVTPQDEIVFLEVNPSGEWGMLEHDLGLPISEAIAEALLDDSGG